jgi:23S rRNA pseudouridine1911/1915/1917 synthase
MAEARELRLTSGDEGRRLDAVLAEHWTDLSRTRLQKLLRDGAVRVDGAAAKPSHPAKSGEIVTATLPDPEPSHLEPEAIPLRIVFEDEHLLVVDKPAGLVVHPGAGNRRGTLVHALLHYLPGLAGVGAAGRPGIVHRLDKGTSGLLLVAKTEAVHRRLAEALARREIARTYWALAWGEPVPAEGRIAEPIGRHPKDRKRMAVVPGGRPAATRYRVLESGGWASLLECALETGRTHQIRVHLSQIGHPVLGDEVYGGGRRRALNTPLAARRLAREAMGGLLRPALHAFRLAFPHPVTAGPIALESPLPEDFLRVLTRLRASGRWEISPAHPSR